MPGAGAGAAEQFYSEPEPEPECFPGAGADQKCHGSASLGAIVPNNRALCRIVEIECTISKQRALAPKLTAKRCIYVTLTPRGATVAIGMRKVDSPEKGEVRPGIVVRVLGDGREGGR